MKQSMLATIMEELLSKSKNRPEAVGRRYISGIPDDYVGEEQSWMLAENEEDETLLGSGRKKKFKTLLGQ